MQTFTIEAALQELQKVKPLSVDNPPDEIAKSRKAQLLEIVLGPNGQGLTGC